MKDNYHIYNFVEMLFCEFLCIVGVKPNMGGESCTVLGLRLMRKLAMSLKFFLVLF